MIQTTYIRLERAAEILETDADTLLIAASEWRVKLYWLFNMTVMAEAGEYEDEVSGDPDAPPFNWIVHEEGPRHFMYSPLEAHDAANLLRQDVITASLSWLSDPDPDGRVWRPICGWAQEGSGIHKDHLRVTKNDVFVKREHVEAIHARGRTPDPGTITEQPAVTDDRSHVSDRLALLNQAARKYWVNVKRSDATTHPNNADVAAWLIERGLSKSQAEKAASIIRPGWAHNGRKPD